MAYGATLQQAMALSVSPLVEAPSYSWTERLLPLRVGEIFLREAGCLTLTMSEASFHLRVCYRAS